MNHLWKKTLSISLSILVFTTVTVRTTDVAARDNGKAKKAKQVKKFKQAKNVIIMISDGAGYNTHLSTEYWHGTKQPYDHPSFAKYPVATYNLRYGGPSGTAPGDNSVVTTRKPTKPESAAAPSLSLDIP